MRDRTICRLEKLALFSIFILIFSSQDLQAQAKRILPFGNSITWGKVNQAPPPAGTHGYRDYLFNGLAGYGAKFTGPRPPNPYEPYLGDGTVGTDPPYLGYYIDGARIGQFLPDSTYDVVGMLNQMDVDSLPHIVVMHLGTNDMFSTKIVGDYLTPGSIVYDLNTLVSALLSYNRGGHTIEDVLLCKIIPVVGVDGVNSYPVENSRVLDYNAKMEQMVNGLAPADQDKITLVNMHAAFYANQFTYYNEDMDHVHPNDVGYGEMGTILTNYLQVLLRPSIVDEFDRAAGALDNTNGWDATASIQIANVGENGGGAIYSNDVAGGTPPATWRNVAIWDSSRAKNASSIRFHDNADPGLVGITGLLVGMNGNDEATADGYMVWIVGGVVRIWTVENGQATTAVTSYTPIPNYGPGDIFRVNYVITSDQNFFYISINEGEEYRLRHITTTYGKEPNFYSGVIFENASGTPPAPASLIDYFKVESRLQDDVPPGRVANFQVFATTNSSITLTWIATGDDGYDGTAASYDLRFSTSPILTDTDFENATIVTGIDPPLAAGTPETYTIAGLLSGTRYYFKIRATDRWGNTGELSDPADGSTESIGEIVDNFNRADLGDDWVYNIGEYGIDTQYDEMLNGLTGGWGTPAIYTGRTNPSTVKMVWGHAATNPTQPDIDNGGLILLANEPSIDTDGYFMFIRTVGSQAGIIYLYEIVDGQFGSPIDEVQYELGSYPDQYDTLSVVMDWSSDSYNKFNVYVNGQAAAIRALYDNNKTYGRVSTNYAGILLGRLAGSRNNNVSAFITAGEHTGAATISAVSSQTFQGTVNTILSDSVRVEVLDQNHAPASAIPVFFRVTEGGGEVSAPQPIDEHIRIETEWGVTSGTMSVGTDPLASGGEYVVGPAGAPRSGWVTIQFYVETAGTYYFWGRAKATYWTSVIVMFELDGTPSSGFNWRVLEYEGQTTDTWKWGRVRQEGIPSPFSRTLSSGLHIVRIYKGHNNVPLDKLLVTSDPSYIPVGLETVGTLLTDANGQAASSWTLGQTAGLNRIEARAFGTIQSVEFLADGLPDVPVSVDKMNDNQSGAAREMLTNPFAVTYYDQYANRTPGLVVNFEVIEGDGQLTATSDTTDANGEASTFLVLGIQDSLNQVRATLPGHPEVDPVVFTATTTSGLVSEIRSLTEVGEKHYVGQVLPNFLEVQVFDDEENPVDSTLVTFEVVEGDGWAGKPKWTNLQGIARDTLYLGQTASIVTVLAGVVGIQDTVAVDSIFYEGAKLAYYSGDKGSAFISDTLEFRLKVRVLNSQNQPVEDHPVTFVTKGHGFHFPGGGDSTVAHSNISGIARTNVVLGLVHGGYPNIVEAWSSDGFNPIPNSPIRFTLYAKSSAAFLKEIEGDSLEGVVQEMLPNPLKVQMVDANQEPVTSQPVIFSIKGGGGQFEGTLLPTDTVMTDGDGYAQVFYIFGSEAGFFNNIVEASATNGIDKLTGSPVVFYLSAKSSAADSIAAFSDTVFTGVAGKPLSQPVQVQVTDRLKNPVSGEEVTFTVIAGGGVLDGSADTTQTVLIDNAGGIAEVDWTLGTQAGTLNNVLEAASDDGILALKGSPIYFYASVVADSVSSSRSTIEATEQVQATSNDTCWITVMLMDAYGNPVSGKRVRLEVTGGDLNFVHHPTEPTDSLGKAYGYLISLTSGEKSIRAKDIDDDVRLDTEVTVVFLATDAAEIQVFSGNAQTGNVGTVLKDSLTVKVTDQNDNPVSYGPVIFEVIAGGGRIIEPQPVVSDSNGLAWAHLVLGPAPGENVVKVTSEGLQGSPLYFTAAGEEGVAISMITVSGHPQTGPAGERLPLPFVIGVKDLDGDAVAQVDIFFEVEIGNGVLETPQPVQTDEFGNASAYFRTDTLAGMTCWVKAYNNDLSGSPRRFSATSTAGTPRKITYVSGDGQPGYVGRVIYNPLVVRVTDHYGNAVSGVSVLFEVVLGDASIQGSQAVTVVSNTSGLASTYVTLGQTTGTVKVEASSQFLVGSPVLFTLFVQAEQAEGIEMFSGDNQKGTVGSLLVDPLRVRVIDDYNNSVPGISVFFTKDAGEGTIIEDQPVMSDSNGIASIHFRVGPTPGTAVVSALWSDKVISFNAEAVINPNFPVLDKNIIDDSYDVSEGDQLSIVLAASDADNDPLTFQIGNIFPPEGATIPDPTTNPTVFRWTPHYDQDGSHTIILRVVDGRGGVDADTVTVNVLNVNRTPEIVATIPVGDTTVVAGQTVNFWVDAQDPDGDPLTYSWEVDGQEVGSDLPFYQHYIDKYFAGNQIVDVFVSDGTVAKSFRWNLNVLVSVELTEFAAEFDEERIYVQVWWSTSRESDNTGFDVYRSQSEEGEYMKINDEFIPSKDGGKYNYIDWTVQVGHTYYYKLANRDVRGNWKEYGPVRVEVPVPEKLVLSQNYPNPFNPVTIIRYQVPKRESITLTIYNMMGQRVVTLADREHDPGYFVAEWDGRDEVGRDVSTGIYIYRLRSTKQVITRRMVKMK